MNKSNHLHQECRCGFSKRLTQLRAKTGKRLGILGATIMILHFLFHVVECLVLPAILVGLGGQVTQEDAIATSENLTSETNAEIGAEHNSIVNWNFYDAWVNLDLNQSGKLLLGDFET